MLREGEQPESKQGKIDLFLANLHAVSVSQHQPGYWPFRFVQGFTRRIVERHQLPATCIDLVPTFFGAMTLHVVLFFSLILFLIGSNVYFFGTCK